MKAFFLLFFKESKWFYIFLLLIGFMNSVVNSAFMIALGKFISNNGELALGGKELIVFVILFLLCLVLNYSFNTYSIKISTSIAQAIELDLLARIKNSSYKNLNNLPGEEVYAILGNMNLLSEAPGKFSGILFSLFAILVCLIYSFWISFIYGISLLALTLTLIGIYFYRSRIFTRKYNVLNRLKIQFYSYLSDLLRGYKDLKMSIEKSDSIYAKHITLNRKRFRELDANLKRDFSNGLIFTSYIWYFILGILVFVLSKSGAANSEFSASFVIILLYILSPISHVTSFFPFYSQLKAALVAIERIKGKLDSYEPKSNGSNMASSNDQYLSIRCENIVYSHFNKGNNEVFHLGPINLEFRKGELVFIVGGNGSGKSTFIHLLSGLEQPISGTLFFNEQIVKEVDLVKYRNKIAAVFFDGYILSQNYEKFVLNESNEKFVHYLKLMKLNDLPFSNNIYNNKHALSKGQQKRLALILALLLDREVLILDEWAAEQDPGFKEYFYNTVIPSLKCEGKTIIAITHDDQYTHCADRIIKFRDGRVLN